MASSKMFASKRNLMRKIFDNKTGKNVSTWKIFRDANDKFNKEMLTLDINQ